MSLTTIIVCHGVIESASLRTPHRHWITYKLALDAMWALESFFSTHRTTADRFLFLSWTEMLSGRGKTRLSVIKGATQSLEQPVVQHLSDPPQSPSRLHAAEHSSRRTGMLSGQFPGLVLNPFTRKVQDSWQLFGSLASLQTPSKQVELSEVVSRQGRTHWKSPGWGIVFDGSKMP